MFADLLEADEGHPQIGKELKRSFHEAGFKDIRTSGSFNFFGTAEEIEAFYDMVTHWFLSMDISEAAKKYGAATDSLLAEIGIASDQWRKQPRSFGSPCLWRSGGHSSLIAGAFHSHIPALSLKENFV